MGCVTVKSLSGREREVCDGKLMPPKDQIQQTELIVSLDKAIGGGAGDSIKAFMAPVAKLLGKHGCSPCETRRVVANAFGKLQEKHGKIKATTMVMELMAMSTKDTLGTAKRLQEYLQ